MNDTAGALFDHGARAVEAGDYAGAVSTFRQILDLEEVADDYRAMACVNLATVYGDCMGDVEQALAWYQTASDLAVNNALFVGSKWVAYLVDQHRYVEAIPILTRLVQSADIGNDDKAMTCVNLATVHDRMGNVDEALAWYQTALDLAVEKRRWIERQRAAYLWRRRRRWLGLWLSRFLRA